MAKAELNAIVHVQDFQVNLSLTPLQAMALLVVGQHIAGLPGSLRTSCDEVTDSLAEALGFSEDGYNELFEELVDSGKSYNPAGTDHNDCELYFNPVDLANVRRRLSKHLQLTWDKQYSAGTV